MWPQPFSLFSCEASLVPPMGDVGDRAGFARWTGLEPATSSFGDWCSIQLNYHLEDRGDGRGPFDPLPRPAPLSTCRFRHAAPAVHAVSHVAPERQSRAIWSSAGAPVSGGRLMWDSASFL